MSLRSIRANSRPPTSPRRGERRLARHMCLAPIRTSMLKSCIARPRRWSAKAAWIAGSAGAKTARSLSSGRPTLGRTRWRLLSGNDDIADDSGRKSRTCACHPSKPWQSRNFSLLKRNPLASRFAGTGGKRHAYSGTIPTRPADVRNRRRSARASRRSLALSWADDGHDLLTGTSPRL